MSKDDNKATLNPIQGADTMANSYRFIAGEELLELAIFHAKGSKVPAYDKVLNALNEHLSAANLIKSKDSVEAWCTGESAPHIRYHVAIAKVLAHGGDPGKLWKKEVA